MFTNLTSLGQVKFQNRTAPDQRVCVAPSDQAVGDGTDGTTVAPVPIFRSPRLHSNFQRSRRYRTGDYWKIYRSLASFSSLAGSYCLCFGLLGLHRALVAHGSLSSRQPVSKKSGLCEAIANKVDLSPRGFIPILPQGKELMDLQVARMNPCHDCRPSSARPARCFRRGSGCSVCSACAQSKNIYITGRGVDPSLA